MVERLSEQGYLVMALDKTKFVDMARPLARSIRLFDPVRPVGLVYNEGSVSAASDLSDFDVAVHMPYSDKLVGIQNRFRLNKYTPFRKTMLVDADCLMVKYGIEWYWRLFDERPLAMLASKKSSGSWHGKDLTNMCEILKVPYVARGNAGVIYFEQSLTTDQIFDYMAETALSYNEQISRIHRDRRGGFASEPIIGAAFGAFGLEPQSALRGVGSLMITTWLARRCVFDLKLGVSYLEKPAGLWGNINHHLLAKRWVAHSPIFAHFIKLKPEPVYASLVDQISSLATQNPEERRNGWCS